jgi:site-specific DNA-methyltransferase (adenine-specific)
MQDFSKPWTDEELYKKYGLTEEEVEFIESLVKPMYEKATKEDK